MKSQAVAPLTNTPMPAVQAMTPPGMGTGWTMRRMLSATMTPTAISSSNELKSEMRTVLFLYP